MTYKQPEALRLAELIEQGRGKDVFYANEAAAELRRLHEENKQWQEKCMKYIEIHDAVVADSDKLLTALAQPEHGCAECDKKQSEGWALYCVDCLREFYKLDPTNQRREWVGLTEEERLEIIAVGGEAAVLYVTEAKLKEKNSGRL